MTPAPRRWPVRVLAGAALIALASGCGSSGNPGSAPQSAQQLYVARLSRDRQSLDRGVLAYSPIRKLATAATRQFRITVTDVGNGPQLTQVTSFDHMTVYQQDVPAGGIVGVQLVACRDLMCHSESGLRQPVLEKGQSAQWLWEITGGTPGTALITLRADTYDAGTTQSLSEEIIRISLTVTATSAFDKQQARRRISSAVGDIETAGSVAAAIGAVGGIASWILRRRKRKAAAPGGDVPARPEKPGRLPETQALPAQSAGPPAKISNQDDQQEHPAAPAVTRPETHPREDPPA